MTEFTLDQIKDAGASDEVIAKLTEPMFKPEVGQVIMALAASDNWFPMYALNEQHGSENPRRPQNLTEHGPDVRALQDALKLITKGWAYLPADVPYETVEELALETLRNHEIKE